MKYFVCMKASGTVNWVGTASFLWLTDAKMFLELLVSRDPDKEFNYRLMDGEDVLEEV